MKLFHFIFRHQPISISAKCRSISTSAQLVLSLSNHQLISTSVFLFLAFNFQLLTFSSYAQTPGAIDLTFNPADIGFGNGDGAGNTVSASAIQSDGKIIIGGAFTSYNGTTINRIARLNTDGTIDAAFNPAGAGASNTVSAIAIQSDGKIIIGGLFTTYNGTARRSIARLNADGTLDGAFTVGTGANNTVSAIAIQSNGQIIIGGSFTSYNSMARRSIARLNTNGTLESTATFTLGGGANTTVSTIAIQSDGKIIIGGAFTGYNGTARARAARLNTNGTLDGTFTVGTGADNTVAASAIQSDGKIIIAGSFLTYNGAAISRIARLKTDGTLDSTFIFNAGVTGAASIINTAAIQSDGKIIIGGAFTSYNGTAINYIARLNTDGTLDGTFAAAGTGLSTTVNTAAIQGDGEIIIGGAFLNYNGTIRNRVARLNSDGTLDGIFNAGTGANNVLSSIALQSDGKIIIGGGFTSYNGTAINHIARLNTDGTLDGTFTVGTGSDNTVNSIVLQSDGKIIIGGAFGVYNGTSSAGIARLNADGTLDGTFTVGAGADNTVETIAIQSDGKIIIGGVFTNCCGTAINHIARLNADGTLDGTFTVGTGANNTVFAAAIQSNGKIIIGGDLTSYNGTSSIRTARLNADGTFDGVFNIGTGANSTVQTIAVESDGKIIIGGAFTSYNGTAINNIVRLYTNGTLDGAFTAGTGANAAIGASAIQSDGNIIIAGAFTSYNGTGRNRIARILGNCIVIAASAAADTVCSGVSVTLRGSGAASYVWTGGITDGISFVPSSTLTYTVTGTTGACSNTDLITITVYTCGLTKNGVNSVASTNFVDANGQIVSSRALNQNGHVLGSAAFNYTGTSQTWIVPNDITSITVKAWGGGGGGGGEVGAVGGGGANAFALISVTPGETLTVIVGGGGGQGTGCLTNTGGGAGGTGSGSIGLEVTAAMPGHLDVQPVAAAAAVLFLEAQLF